jgi:cation diffusion facilitator family transporter
MDQEQTRNQVEQKIIVKVSFWTIVLNALLAVMKIITGIIGKSSAILSDAVNSISDVASALVVMITGRLSRKEKDKDHPYGHEKYESLISVFLGFALLITAFEIGKAGVETIYAYFVNGTPIVVPNYVALIAAVMTIVVKEGMYLFTRRNAKKAQSPALFAMSLDHRSDEFASFGAILGIGGAMLGLSVLEPIASIVICLFIVRLGFKIIGVGVSQVIDQAADEVTVARIKEITAAQPGIKHLDDLKTRMFGMRLFVDMEIAVSPKLTILEAHHISHLLHDEIEAKIPNVKHCMIHVNPYKTEEID